jgi:hypothetical protein
MLIFNRQCVVALALSVLIRIPFIVWFGFGFGFLDPSA